MKRVFLSHSTSNKKFALRLANHLRENNIKIWTFEADIKIGDSLIAELQKAIDELDYLIIILSPQAINSNWVNKEIETVLFEEISCNHIKLLPVLWKKCEIPSFLKGKIYADFRSEKLYEINFPRLVCRINNWSATSINYLKVKTPTDKQFALRYFNNLKSSISRRIYRYFLEVVQSGKIEINQIHWGESEVRINCLVPNTVLGAQDIDCWEVSFGLLELTNFFTYLENNIMSLTDTGTELYNLLEPWHVDESTWFSYWTQRSGPYKE